MLVFIFLPTGISRLDAKVNNNPRPLRWDLTCLVFHEETLDLWQMLQLLRKANNTLPHTAFSFSWGFLQIDNTSRPYSSCGVSQRWMHCICLCGACACMLTDPCNGISPSRRAWGWSQAGVFMTVRGLRWIIRSTKGAFCSIHTHTRHSLVRDLLYIGHQQAIDRSSRALRCDEVH